jgi:ABC-type transport system substrate-binding protein
MSAVFHARKLAHLLTLAALTIAACAPSTPAPGKSDDKAGQALTKPTTEPTAASVAQKTAPVASKAAAAEPAGKPAVQRLVMSVPPPGYEGSEPRHINQPDAWQIRPMYEFLIGLQPETGLFEPQLATEWSLQPDGRTYRFTLRQEVQFHKGFGKLTARDVVHTWKELLREDTTHGSLSYWRRTIPDVDTNITVVNDYELIFRLPQPDANFISALSEAEGTMEIHSKAEFDQQGPGTMERGPNAGTGPYQFKERVQGSYLRFERVPYQHWRVTPDFPEFEFRFQKEPSTRLAALLNGEVHVTTLPEDLLETAQRQGFKTIAGRVPGLRAFLSIYCCNLREPTDPSQGWFHPDSQLRDLRVRKALNKAINRDEINKAIFGGKGQPMFLNHFHPTRKGWNPEWERRFAEEYGYDPDKSRALLAESGFTAGRPLTTTVFVEPLPQFSGAPDLSEAIAGYWRTVGVQSELLQMDSGQILSGYRAFKFDSHFRVVGTSAAQLIGTATYKTSMSGRGGMEDPESDTVMRQIYLTLDERKQEDLWRQIGDLMFDRHMDVPLFWLPAEAVVSPAVVDDYVFPGSISGTWTHVHNIHPAR